MLGIIHNASAAENVSDEAPSLELLEYLGTLVEEDGELIGPEDFGDDEEERVDDFILLGDDDEIPEEWR